MEPKNQEAEKIIANVCAVCGRELKKSDFIITIYRKKKNSFFVGKLCFNCFKRIERNIE